MRSDCVAARHAAPMRSSAWALLKSTSTAGCARTPAALSGAGSNVGGGRSGAVSGAIRARAGAGIARVRVPEARRRRGAKATPAISTSVAMSHRRDVTAMSTRVGAGRAGPSSTTSATSRTPSPPGANTAINPATNAVACTPMSRPHAPAPWTGTKAAANSANAIP